MLVNKWQHKTTVVVTVVLFGLGSITGTFIGGTMGAIGVLGESERVYVGGDGPGNFSSIQEGINAASDGTTIFVYNGTYYENVQIEKKICLLGENKDTTFIDGNLSGDVISVIADEVTVSHFTVRNAGGKKENSGIKIYSDRNLITGNIFHDNGNNRYCYAQGGIYLSQAANNEISHNEIFNNCETGIYLYQADNNIIYNNTTWNNNIMALVSNASSHNIIIGNDIYDNYCGMTYWPASTHNAILGNDIHDHPGCGIALKEGSNHNTIKYNNLTNNFEWGIMLGFGPTMFNIIEYNTIQGSGGGEMNWFNGSGLVLSIAFFNTIQNNNFGDNKNDVYLENSLFNIWRENYWQNHTGSLKVIPGHFAQPYTYHPLITIPWFAVDWQPVQNSNDLKSQTLVVLGTSMGSMVLELYKDKMPITTHNFARLADDDFFQGLVFHRVIDGFVIQGGGYYPNGSRKESPYDPIVLETHPDIRHVDGAISMARTSDPNSATSQFFICDSTQQHLDDEYAAFGKIIAGMETLRRISTVETTTKHGLQDWPLNEVIINDIIIVSHS